MYRYDRKKHSMHSSPRLNQNYNLIFSPKVSRTHSRTPLPLPYPNSRAGEVGRGRSNTLGDDAKRQHEIALLLNQQLGDGTVVRDECGHDAQPAAYRVAGDVASELRDTKHHERECEEAEEEAEGDVASQRGDEHEECEHEPCEAHTNRR